MDKHLESISKKLEQVYSITSDIDGSLDIIMSDLIASDPFKAMKKKDREAQLKKLAEELFPSIVKEIKAFNAGIEGLSLWIEEAKDKLERQEDLLSDIEQLKDEIFGALEKLTTSARLKLPPPETAHGTATRR
ncbi:MAG: hypothetical protein JNK87_07480 [Bryobacterales bacterium]|nr:hypothetical protein [Bryobacterales bacterium]